MSLKVNKSQLELFFFVSLLIGICFLIQILPSLVSVSLVFFLFVFIYIRKNKILALVSIWIFALSATEFPMGDIALIVIVTILTLLFNYNKYHKIDKRAFFILMLLLFYFVLTISEFFFQDINLTYLYYAKRNLYREFAIPILFIIFYALFKFTSREIFVSIYLTSLFVSLGQFICLALNFEVVLVYGYQFIIPLLSLVYLKEKRWKFLSLFMLSLYLYLFIKKGIYFSSQHIMLFGLFVVFYGVYKRTLLAALGLLILTLLVVLNEFSLYVWLKESLGLDSGIAFKISQIFMVFSNSSFESIPWSPRVRIIEAINTFDRSVFNNLFGSGFVSSITESYLPFISNYGEVLQENDFLISEIAEKKYYGLHNISRGLLHYGVVFFIMLFVIFIKSIQKIRRNGNDQYDILLCFFYFIITFWNPSLLTMYLLLNMRNNLDEKR